MLMHNNWVMFTTLGVSILQGTKATHGMQTTYFNKPSWVMPIFSFFRFFISPQIFLVSLNTAAA